MKNEFVASERCMAPDFILIFLNFSLWIFLWVSKKKFCFLS